MKHELIEQFKVQFPNEAHLDYEECCFWNQDNCAIADRAPVALFMWEHNDFFLRPLPQGPQAGALKASREKRGELSYYYAHNRQEGLISKAPAAAPATREPLKVVAKTEGGPRFNAKQSPFGTNIAQYETITSYTWEDGGHDGDTVKVLVPLEGVGKLEPSKVRAQFGERQFELLVDGLNGKNLRFACYKTHGEMKPEECKYVVRGNRVNLLLRKAKEKDIWFDLFKKKCIGETDAD